MHLFLFHRDLRIYDNTTLIHQIKEISKNDSIVPIFIFTPEQIDAKKNKYFSNSSVQFLIESLQDLDVQIQKKNGTLNFFYGDTVKVLEHLHSLFGIQSIGYNKDYTPYAKLRDEKIEKFCQTKNIQLFSKEDYALYDFTNGETLKKDKKPYLVYTPFMKFVSDNLKVRAPNPFQQFSFEKNTLVKKCKYFLPKEKLDSFYSKQQLKDELKGGRKNSLLILKKLNTFKNYQKCRNMLEYQTTKLSAYLHYTTHSSREVYHEIVKKLGKSSGLIRELIFRDFYMNIVYYFPRVLEGQVKNTKNKSFQEKYDAIIWENNKSNFEKWCKGQTGFPIVDAGMRQMNESGFMHNRCRMIVSNFLVKDLHLDWRLGEQYFATKLRDYDPINNSSGWQWSTGNGTDAQPWFRIFNPWTQQKDYDPDCKYIKHWIPELESIPPKDLHEWCNTSTQEAYKNINYPSPIVNHTEERKTTLALYKKFV